MQNYDIEEAVQAVIEPTHIRAVVEWNSGRNEVFAAPPKKDKTIPASFLKKMDAYKNFPTVIRVYMQKI